MLGPYLVPVRPNSRVLASPRSPSSGAPSLVARPWPNGSCGGARSPGILQTLVGRDRPLAITFFGVTNIVSPTIIEEYSAVRSLLDSGTITVEECRALVGSLASPDSREEITMVTLFGGCGFETVSEKKQRKALDLAERSGAISSRTRGELEQAIGCPDRAATGIVARAALA